MKRLFSFSKTATVLSIALFSGYAFGYGTYLECVGDTLSHEDRYVSVAAVKNTDAYKKLRKLYGNPKGMNIVSEYNDSVMLKTSSELANKLEDGNNYFEYLIFNSLDEGKKFCEALIKVCKAQFGEAAQFPYGKTGAEGPWYLSFMYIETGTNIHNGVKHYLRSTGCPAQDESGSSKDYASMPDAIPSKFYSEFLYNWGNSSLDNLDDADFYYKRYVNPVGRGQILKPQ